MKNRYIIQWYTWESGEHYKTKHAQILTFTDKEFNKHVKDLDLISATCLGAAQGEPLTKTWDELFNESIAGRRGDDVYWPDDQFNWLEDIYENPILILKKK